MWCIATSSAYQQDLQVFYVSNSIHLFMDRFYNCTIVVAIVQSIMINLCSTPHWWDTRINIDSSVESRSEWWQSCRSIVPGHHAGFLSSIKNLFGAFLEPGWSVTERAGFKRLLRHSTYIFQWATTGNLSSNQDNKSEAFFKWNKVT